MGDEHDEWLRDEAARHAEAAVHAAHQKAWRAEQAASDARAMPPPPPADERLRERVNEADLPENAVDFYDDELLK